MPIRKGQSIDDIEVHELPGGPCISLIHRGPYEQIGEAYQRLTQFAEERGLEIVMPSREIYLKGPGMIFKGNPLRYLTDIQMLIARLRNWSNVKQSTCERNAGGGGCAAGERARP